MLKRQVGVQQAVVLLQESSSTHKQLQAYLVPEPGHALSLEQVREALGRQLPSYMQLAGYRLLPRLPLTANGKLDRRALLAEGGQAEEARREEQREYVAPRTQEERSLAHIWEQVLRVPRVGVQDNYFELGGDSILGISIIARANQANFSFTLKDLFEHQTIAALMLAREGEHSAESVKLEATGSTSTQNISVELSSEDMTNLMSELSETKE
ncbi:hypothetical protein EPA93_15050 [Ktedonosporobacter rubrisoli]|uniref:Carrier domain-containing protein n=1 Tax=Ktedonosporobacter rubrisoli TaxID=2509675 RepID=A0A4P6JPD0_KTERU|nr:phosphopantetheine-binding protein [Ktedonosporobacter rubrisoli]QBD77239.1 hypothetical protein EPA93_15050 [Ktedonosporobacter rubrisoli]